MVQEAGGKLTTDAKELVLNSDDRFVCETYIFEPTKQEEGLGYLYAVAEIEDRGGVGRQLLELVMAAIQKEYYRDVRRGVSSSFELALHQANLILHDSAERGVKDWMGYFHVAVCVLVGHTLHVSVAGQATVSLARSGSLTEVSEGLSTYPVTNPLRTFSQVASGEVAPRDVLYVGTANFRPLFRSEDLKRFAIDHSAGTIATRLHQLYTDYGLRHPLAVLVVSLLPQYIVSPATPVAGPARKRGEAIHQASLTPRQPIILKRSWIAVAGLIVGRVLAYGWEHFRQTLLPGLRRGVKQVGPLAARAGGQALQFGGQAKRGSAALLQTSKRWKWPRFSTLPRSSKIFAVLAVLFAIALVVSLGLLRSKRAEDTRIQQASEQLHAARVAKDAAVAALIYDNREEAEKLLGEAQALTEQLKTSGLYQEEVEKLTQELTREHDRLQKITRIAGETARVVGDWSELTTAPAKLFAVGEELFTFDPATNAIVKMKTDGATERVTQTTEGIGFFTDGVVQDADKTIVLASNEGGLALFDSKDNSLLKQEVQLPTAESTLTALGLFGNRLYIFDATTDNIYLYNKTLRGYAGGQPWITDTGFAKDSIRSLAVDGNIYTLHEDGQVRRLFKGAASEFETAAVDVSLAGATRVITSEEKTYVYVIDPQNRRVVVLTKDGALAQQIYIDEAHNMRDAAVGPDEKMLFVLDGTRVLEVQLGEGS